MCTTNVLCPLCTNSNFKCIESLRRRLIWIANESIACPQCNDIFQGLDKLTIHLFSHTDTLNCSSSEQLNKKLNLLELSNDKQTLCLKESDNDCHSDNCMKSDFEGLLKCDTCDVSFSTKHKIQNKLFDNNGGEHKNECNIKEVVKKTSCSHHMVSTSPLEKQSIENELVNVCSDEVIASTNINQNEPAKSWECEICKKSFTTKYFLKKHKMLHTGEMPYRCEICGKTFTFQQTYHKHLLYHTDEKPHVCQICMRAFKELSTLQNHKRIHSGEKPFKCENCGKCFRQRVSFLVHTRIHTGVTPYKCPDCQKGFRYKLSLRTHKCMGLERTNNFDDLASSTEITPNFGDPSTMTFAIVEKERSAAKHDMLHNFIPKLSKNVNFEFDNNLDLGNELRNLDGNEINSKMLNTPITDEVEVNQFDTISCSTFPHFFYDIGSGYI